MTSTATFEPLYGGGFRRGGLIGEAEKEEKKAGRGAKRTAKNASKAALKRLEGPISQASHHSVLERAAREALHEKGVHERTTMAQAIGSTQDIQRSRQEAELNREIATGEAVKQAAAAANWLARVEALDGAGKSAEALERVAQAYLPLVDAVEAGLWLFWVTADDVIAVAAPTAS